MAGRKTLCVECGPDVAIDEDGCCLTCGNGATGTWLDNVLCARDVSEDDLSALRWARQLVMHWRNPFNPDLTTGSMKSAAVAALDKLLGKERG